MRLASKVNTASSPSPISLMADKQIRKRRFAEVDTKEDREVKKLRRPAFKRHSSNFSPYFWKSLSIVNLTPRALRELDRQNGAKLPTRINSPQELFSGNLARFARQGGPNLEDLRSVCLTFAEISFIANGGQYCNPALDTMADSPASNSSQGRKPQSTRVNSASVRSRKSSAYDRNFQEHLIRYEIYPDGFKYPDGLSNTEPGNLDHLQEGLFAQRASLSPSQFTQAKFRDFKEKNAEVVFESDVMSKVIPIISGSSTIHSQQNVLFTEVEAIANEDVVKPKPDLFDGAHLRDLHTNLRDDESLRSIIVPTKHPNVPVASNFFLEAKGPDGNAAVAQRQACYDGAHGSKAMHALQTHKQTEPAYDGKAFTYSYTYHAGTGTLQFYAHHISAPKNSGDRPSYHMTQIDGWQMTGNINTFRRGATAFRNTRDLAKTDRDEFIRLANAAVESTTLGESDDIEAGTLDTKGFNSSRKALSDSSSTGSSASEDANPRDRALGIHTEENAGVASQTSTALSIDDPSLSFASSGLSNLGAETSRSKRARQLSSPTSSWGRCSKSRNRPSVKHLATREPPA